MWVPLRSTSRDLNGCVDSSMRDLVVLFIHLLATLVLCCAKISPYCSSKSDRSKR